MDTSKSTGSVDALPRRVVFCVDVGLEMKETLGSSVDGGIQHSLLQTSSRLETTLFLIRRYIAMNQLIASSDQYAVVLLQDKAKWWVGFSNDLDEIEVALQGIECHEYKEIFGRKDVNDLLITIAGHSDLSDQRYFTQVILIYGRAQHLPLSMSKVHRRVIRDSQRFTMDVLFLHGPSDTRCKVIYETLQSFDSRTVPGWYFEFRPMARSSFTKAMAQLVAHPSQRSDRRSASQVLEPVNAPEEDMISLDSDAGQG
ncbi:uncharacterized protein BYT42DRAFT_216777 [Radiomyces spectabilis]|uniref:uncharacterized protein n=1 Tax=Radiomyces spectabilis TaxID=64574 RepID=UPI00222103C2|nr:uncharacterized protein BYT42DRAFT_216777 [Radiomyces spectabilis]KAI8387986.1 hypothetical protein BYT42DRAFT_216777 [Radiomyces spectabilis]